MNPDRSGSRAVLIGVANYSHPGVHAIPAVANNIIDLQASLTAKSGGAFIKRNCEIVTDPHREAQVGMAISRASREATDILLVYYSGHGFLDRRGRLHLALAGTDPDQVRWTSVPFSNIREDIRESGARARVLILDCCFSGRALDAMTHDSELIAGQTDIRGTYTIVSSGANEISMAPSGHHNTAFTAALLEAARTPRISLDTLYVETVRTLRSGGYPVPRRRSIDSAGNLSLFGLSERSLNVSHILDGESAAHAISKPAATEQVTQDSSQELRPATESRRQPDRAWLASGLSYVGAALASIALVTFSYWQFYSVVVWAVFLSAALSTSWITRVLQSRTVFFLGCIVSCSGYSAMFAGQVDWWTTGLVGVGAGTVWAVSQNLTGPAEGRTWTQPIIKWIAVTLLSSAFAYQVSLGIDPVKSLTLLVAALITAISALFAPLVLPRINRSPPPRARMEVGSLAMAASVIVGAVSAYLSFDTELDLPWRVRDGIALAVCPAIVATAVYCFWGDGLTSDTSARYAHNDELPRQ